MATKKYITVTYASGKERLRLGWSTLTFAGKEFQLKDAADNLLEARRLAEKWRRKGYNARINKGPGVGGARYTYAVYTRKRGK
tara:strand:+ start:134 stop:382 length:249 start_codon:yes stop_codon:yes gene_type:complete